MRHDICRYRRATDNVDSPGHSDFSAMTDSELWAPRIRSSPITTRGRRGMTSNIFRICRAPKVRGRYVLHRGQKPTPSFLIISFPRSIEVERQVVSYRERVCKGPQ